MYKYYGIIGTSEQIIVDENINNYFIDNAILMKGERPSLDYIASESGEWIIDKEKNFLELKNKYTEFVQSYMDNKVREKNYDNIFTACSYVNSTDEVFKREGQACCEWRDKIWRKCYDILNNVEDGKIEIPSFEDLIKEFPDLNW